MEKYFKNYNAEDYIRDISAIVEAARRNGLKVCFDPSNQMLVVENTSCTYTHGYQTPGGFGIAAIEIPTDDYFKGDVEDIVKY